MVLNAVQNGAKRNTKSIKIHYNCIDKPLTNHEKHGQKGQNGHQKVGFWGLKVGFGAAKIMGWQPN